MRLSASIPASIAVVLVILLASLGSSQPYPPCWPNGGNSLASGTTMDVAGKYCCSLSVFTSNCATEPNGGVLVVSSTVAPSLAMKAKGNVDAVVQITPVHANGTEDVTSHIVGGSGTVSATLSTRLPTSRFRVSQGLALVVG